MDYSARSTYGPTGLTAPAMAEAAARGGGLRLVAGGGVAGPVAGADVTLNVGLSADPAFWLVVGIGVVIALAAWTT